MPVHLDTTNNGQIVVCEHDLAHAKNGSTLNGLLLANGEIYQVFVWVAGMKLWTIWGNVKGKGIKYVTADVLKGQGA